MKYLIKALFVASLVTMAVSPAMSFDAFTDEQSLAFEYRIAIDRPEADLVRLWLPYPIEDDEQSVQSHEIEKSVPLRRPVQLTREPRYGNRMLYFEIGRDGFPAMGPLQLTIHYRIDRRPARIVTLAQAATRPDLHPGLYSGPNRWLKSNETIREMAREATADATTESARIRAIYDYVYELMTYDKSGEGWGRGDPIWACTAKRGNCTDFHSLYIALAREMGVTARFEIGVPIPAQVAEGEIPGYHCWARVLDSGQGWLPIDASEAKKSGLKDAYFGRIPSDRVAFSVGRDLVLMPVQRGAALNYFIYPYAEAGNEGYDRIRTSFHFRRL